MDFVFTSDIDWASEFAIGNLLSIVGRYGIKPTLFVTHESATIRAAAGAGLVELGIHPNFLPGSSHGSEVDAVIEHTLALAPGATLARCHSFLDGTHIATALVGHGITTDSNLVCYLQAGLAPLHHWAGLLRFPAFWEDDVHWARGGAWTFAPYAERFFSPGLKILNFHPFLVALNVPDAYFYSLNKQHIPTLTREQAEASRFKGKGCATFLIEMLESILAAGHRFVHLSDLARDVRAEMIESEKQRNVG